MPEIAEVLGITTFLAGLALACLYLYLTIRNSPNSHDNDDQCDKKAEIIKS